MLHDILLRSLIFWNFKLVLEVGKKNNSVLWELGVSRASELGRGEDIYSRSLYKASHLPFCIKTSVSSGIKTINKIFQIQLLGIFIPKTSGDRQHGSPPQTLPHSLSNRSFCEEGTQAYFMQFLFLERREAFHYPAWYLLYEKQSFGTANAGHAVVQSV